MRHWRCCHGPKEKKNGLQIEKDKNNGQLIITYRNLGAVFYLDGYRAAFKGRRFGRDNFFTFRAEDGVDRQREGNKTSNRYYK